ncbi:MAG: ROK family protein [Bacteroidota bacterium]
MEKDQLTLTVDLGGTRSKIGVFGQGQLMVYGIYPSFKKENTSHNMALVSDHVKSLCQDHQLDYNTIKYVGLAFPGLVNTDESYVISSSGKYEDADEFDFKNWAMDYFKSKICMDNDSRLACLGERYFGAGKDFSNMVTVTFGTGIGTGVIINNKLLIGKHYQAGCLGGHVPVVTAGRKCHCGNEGCLEAEASLVALEEYASLMPDYKESQLGGKRNFSFQHLFEAYRQKDEVAIQTANYCMDLWATGLISYIHMYDPEVIIVGGGIMQSKDIIIPYFQDKVDRLAWTPSHKVQIVVASLDDKAGVYGAYAMCNNRIEIY